MIEPVGSTLVVTANAFNPSIFTQLWLSKQGLVADGEFSGTSVTTEAAAQHDLANMQLLVVPPRLQVTLKPGDDASAEAGRGLVAGIVGLLPHTPFQALGMNLEFLVTLSTDDFPGTNRAMFLVQPSPFADAFSGNDARFGGYFSRSIGEIRMKLDIKPVTTAGEVGGSGDKLRCAFNFHLDLKNGDRAEPITRALSQWGDFRKQARELLEDVERHGGQK
jgi:hypothetical protein